MEETGCFKYFFTFENNNNYYGVGEKMEFFVIIKQKTCFRFLPECNLIHLETS